MHKSVNIVQTCTNNIIYNFKFRDQIFKHFFQNIVSARRVCRHNQVLLLTCNYYMTNFYCTACKQQCRRTTDCNICCYITIIQNFTEFYGPHRSMRVQDNHLTILQIGCHLACHVCMIQRRQYN